MYRLIKTLFIMILLVFVLVPSFADESIITLGGADGWPQLSFEQGLTRGKGRLGKDALVLSTNLSDTSGESASSPTLQPVNSFVYVPAGSSRSSGTQMTDLYLSFDGSAIADAEGNYSVKSNDLRIVGGSKARRGAGSALCNTAGTGLVMRGKPGSLFSSSGDIGSFTIEFWMYPSVTETGDTVFEWRSSRVSESSGAIYQYIRSSLYRNHLQWTFSNIWTTTDGAPIEIMLDGRKNLIPNEWSHHEISFDAASGELEYRMNGSVEAIRFVTSTSTEMGDVFPALLGLASNISIAPRFTGLIDEFRITRSPAVPDSLENRHATLDRFASSGGRFETNPIDSGGLESVLNSLTVVELTPTGTGTAYFVRAGDNFYDWNQDTPAWIPVEPGKKITGAVGKYFQIAGELYPDGTGQSSPSVTAVSLHYEKDTAPWPPSKVFATAGDGSVIVEWISSVDFDTAGYLVYYGERPGEYLGADSPIDAGKNRSCTVSGLKNGKVYYFCVAAYDASGPRHPGSLSGEAWARPLAVRRGIEN